MMVCRQCRACLLKVTIKNDVLTNEFKYIDVISYVLLLRNPVLIVLN